MPQLLVDLIAIYAMSVVGFISFGLDDQIRTRGEAIMVLVCALVWPAVHLHWRAPISSRGRHRASRRTDPVTPEQMYARWGGPSAAMV